MNRNEANNELTLIEIYDYGMDSGYDCDKVYDLIHKIYDNFEAQLKEKDAEITRLRSQISRGHDSQCSCSFCKPSFIYGDPNVHETATTEKD